jgi:hypothetical protein
MVTEQAPAFSMGGTSLRDLNSQAVERKQKQIGFEPSEPRSPWSPEPLSSSYSADENNVVASESPRTDYRPQNNILQSQAIEDKRQREPQSFWSSGAPSSPRSVDNTAGPLKTSSTPQNTPPQPRRAENRQQPKSEQPQEQQVHEQRPTWSAETPWPSRSVDNNIMTSGPPKTSPPSQKTAPQSRGIESEPSKPEQLQHVWSAETPTVENNNTIARGPPGTIPSPQSTPQSLRSDDRQQLKGSEQPEPRPLRSTEPSLLSRLIDSNNATSSSPQNTFHQPQRREDEQQRKDVERHQELTASRSTEPPLSSRLIDNDRADLGPPRTSPSPQNTFRQPQKYADEQQRRSFEQRREPVVSRSTEPPLLSSNNVTDLGLPGTSSSPQNTFRQPQRYADEQQRRDFEQRREPTASRPTERPLPSPPVDFNNTIAPGPRTNPPSQHIPHQPQRVETQQQSKLELQVPKPLRPTESPTSSRPVDGSNETNHRPPRTSPSGHNLQRPPKAEDEQQKGVEQPFEQSPKERRFEPTDPPSSSPSPQKPRPSQIQGATISSDRTTSASPQNSGPVYARTTLSANMYPGASPPDSTRTNTTMDRYPRPSPSNPVAANTLVKPTENQYTASNTTTTSTSSASIVNRQPESGTGQRPSGPRATYGYRSASPSSSPEIIADRKLPEGDRPQANMARDSITAPLSQQQTTTESNDESLQTKLKPSTTTNWKSSPKNDVGRVSNVPEISSVGPLTIHYLLGAQVIYRAKEIVTNPPPPDVRNHSLLLTLRSLFLRLSHLRSIDLIPYPALFSPPTYASQLGKTLSLQRSRNMQPTNPYPPNRTLYPLQNQRGPLQTRHKALRGSLLQSDQLHLPVFVRGRIMRILKMVVLYVRRNDGNTGIIRIQGVNGYLALYN